MFTPWRGNESWKASRIRRFVIDESPPLHPRFALFRSFCAINALFASAWWNEGRRERGVGWRNNGRRKEGRWWLLKLIERWGNSTRNWLSKLCDIVCIYTGIIEASLSFIKRIPVLRSRVTVDKRNNTTRCDMQMRKLDHARYILLSLFLLRKTRNERLCQTCYIWKCRCIFFAVVSHFFLSRNVV